MTRSIHRRSLAARLFSTYVVMVMLVSFAGLGYAAPKAANDTDNTKTVEVTADPQPEAPGESVAPEEVAPDPDPAETPPAEEPVADEPVIEEAVPVEEPAVPQESGAKSAPVVSAAVAPAAAGASFRLEGFDKEDTKWTTGNLGSYPEGDWVAHRLIIDNSKNDSAYTLPQGSITMDHYRSLTNAIFYDLTRNWTFATKGVASGPWSDTDPSQPAGSAIPLVAQDAATSGTYGVDAPTIYSTFPGGTLTVPAKSYGVIYWQGHLAMSAYWQHAAGIWGSGPWSPGSPSHTWLTMAGEGAKKVPIPSVDLPSGRISGLKFNDWHNRGTKDADEGGLGGWVFHLTGGPEGWPLDLTATSASDGTFAFENLPPATYYLDEESSAPWLTSATLPMAVVVVGNGTTQVQVGNYIPNVRKTFELSIDEPSGIVDSYLARFWVGGDSADVILSGSGPFSGWVDLPHGTVIDSVDWYAVIDGVEHLLYSEQVDETLDADITNRFAYDSHLSGHKFADLDFDGEWDDGEPGLEGWKIMLYRAGMAEPYAVTWTDGDGYYEFTDVLPGEYTLAEENQGGWYATASPDGVSVEHGTETGGLDFGNVEVLSGIDVEKSGPQRARVGDTITYTITVTNVGATTLTDVEAFDPLLGGVVGTVPMLAPGDSETFYPQYTVMADDDDPLPNLVLATGTDLLQDIVSDEDEWSVDIVHPAFTLTKNVSPEDILAGDGVVYTYTVTNTGDVPLSGLTLDDDKLGSITLLDTDLGVGESIVTTVGATISVDTTNVATAIAYDEWDDPYEKTDTAFVDVHAPGISVVKSAMPDVIYEGEWVNYTYLITNTGDTPLWGITLVDDILGDLGWTGFPTALAPGESTLVSVWTQVYSDVTNVGTVVGYYGEPDSDFSGWVDDDSSQDVDVVAPRIEVRKYANPNVILSGATVDYGYEVENTGDSMLTDVVLVDDMLGPITLTDTELSPGEIAYGLASDEISVDTTNIATATGMDVTGREVSDEDSAFVDVVAPALRIDKSVAPSMIAYEGLAFYDFVVTNTGDVTLYGIEVSDDVLGFVGVIDELAPGDSDGFYGVEHFTDTDTTNTATAMGYDEWKHPASDTDQAFVDIIHPELSIEKTVAPDHVLAGDTVTYTYLVRNVGDVTLYDLVVTDDVLGEIGTIAELGVGDEWELTQDAVINEDVANVGTVVGYWTEEPSDEGYVEADDGAFVDVVNPSIDVLKSAFPDTIVFSGAVDYYYWVHNTGDVPLLDVTVVDDMLGTVASGFMLDSDETTMIVVTTTIDEDTENRVDATGTDEWGHEVTDFDVAFVDVVHPEVSLDKSVSPSEGVLAGEEVTYTYIVTNTGDVPLNGLDLVDDKLGPVGSYPMLLPGEMWTVNQNANVFEDTLNEATVTAGFGLELQGPDEEPFMADWWVWDSDTAFVDVVAPAIQVVKTGSTDSVIDPGEDVTYEYTVTNTGDVPLFGITLEDDVLGSVGAVATLEPGESADFNATDFIAEDTTNTVLATGFDQWEHEVADSDDWFVLFEPFEPFPPDLGITKSADKASAKPGDLVTYTLTYTNTDDPELFPNSVATNFTITDDYDQRYASVVDADGGSVADGMIEWTVPGPLGAGESGTIVYTMRIASEMPTGTTNVDNVVVIRSDGDPNPDNDRDTERVPVSEDEPFLPFTGGDAARLLALLVAATLAGTALRRHGRKTV